MGVWGDLPSFITLKCCIALQVPKKWREELRQRQISTGRSKLHHSVMAPDGTRKFLLQLHDGLIVEAVGIPADDADKSRLTACVSSQVTLNSVAALHLCICACASASAWLACTQLEVMLVLWEELGMAVGTASM